MTLRKPVNTLNQRDCSKSINKNILCFYQHITEEFFLCWKLCFGLKRMAKSEVNSLELPCQQKDKCIALFKPKLVAHLWIFQKSRRWWCSDGCVCTCCSATWMFLTRYQLSILDGNLTIYRWCFLECLIRKRSWDLGQNILVGDSVLSQCKND